MAEKSDLELGGQPQVNEVNLKTILDNVNSDLPSYEDVTSGQTRNKTGDLVTSEAEDTNNLRLSPSKPSAAGSTLFIALEILARGEN